MDKRISLFASLILLTCVSCVPHVTQQYAAYVGNNAIYEGKGGTMFEVNGIDFWTTGTPPKKFKLLGILYDKRRSSRLAQSSFNDDVSKKVKEVNGDAVILNMQSVESLGSVNLGQSFPSTPASSNMYGYNIILKDVNTEMLVIKYIE